MTRDPGANLAPGSGGAPSGLEPWAPEALLAPAPAAVEPEGFVVLADGDVRIHFLDWGGPAEPTGPGVLLLPGLLQPASSWAPVARRLVVDRRVAVADLRGQGLSDSPMEGYDLDALAGDAIAAGQGAGLLADGPVVVAGHGFGALVAAVTARGLGDACAGLVLVDGGWERLEATTGLDVDEFLRGLDEPPEVMRSMDAFLKDRRAFDPGTWDADQERAARDAVVETAAGKVVRAVRPHVVEALVRTMFGYEPITVLREVAAPVIALAALAGAQDVRLDELRRSAAARAEAGHRPVRVAGYPSTGHNLMRYRPADVTAAILEVSG
jgi:pimeloyl-ACP methyl ester carboxylesterase